MKCVKFTKDIDQWRGHVFACCSACSADVKLPAVPDFLSFQKRVNNDIYIYTYIYIRLYNIPLDKKMSILFLPKPDPYLTILLDIKS